jgi:hypothetical protein
MQTFQHANMRTALPWLYLALGLAQAGHSIEEVLTGLWRWMPVVSGAVHERVSLIPVFGWSEQGFAVGNMIIIALMLGFSPLPFLNHSWAWKTATILGVIETVNGFNHVGAAVVSGGYFSGCISGVALILAGTLIWARKWIFKEADK